MTDIVERLRMAGRNGNPDAKEAADEIERLRAALEEIRQNSVWAPRVNEIARRALSGEPT
jgi:hypothetical protein